MLRISFSSFKADSHKLAGNIKPQKCHLADFKMHFIKVQNLHLDKKSNWTFQVFSPTLLRILSLKNVMVMSHLFLRCTTLSYGTVLMVACAHQGCNATYYHHHHPLM
jgi:hypothetical protein